MLEGLGENNSSCVYEIGGLHLYSENSPEGSVCKTNFFANTFAIPFPKGLYETLRATIKFLTCP